MHFFAHLKTVNRHRRLVSKNCFRLGLYWQGLTHDLSKYSPIEFMVGAHYFQGDHSPNDEQRRREGYSEAWLHHKGRNRHHFEYWTDYVKNKGIQPVEMPVKYVAEMICDRIAASRVYRGEAYSDGDPYAFFIRAKDHALMHENTFALLEELLIMLRDKGETETLNYIRKHLL
ncbi:DUF5662 family protein [Bengtsoniella intestinalis]|uniref:DUF5662 family protein n=1 Tax=Bengtsoniella intestinalis TaxID=3073143 RepID=UPI00391F5FF7